MHAFQPIIQRLTQKLQQLLKQQEQLIKEQSKLKIMLAQKEDAEKELTEKITVLEQQNAILKIAAGSMNDVEKKQFEKRLNLYIKDLEKAIVQLSA